MDTCGLVSRVTVSNVCPALNSIQMGQLAKTTSKCDFLLIDYCIIAAIYNFLYHSNRLQDIAV